MPMLWFSLTAGALLIGAVLLWIRHASTRTAFDMPSLYAEPVATRRAWRFHLPGPPALLLIWLFVAPFLASVAFSVLAFVAYTIDASYDRLTRGRLERDLKIAEERVRLDSAAWLQAEEARINEEAQRKKGGGALWFAPSPAQLEQSRQADLRNAREREGLRLPEAIERAKEAVEKQRRARGPKATRWLLAFGFLGPVLWLLPLLYFLRLWWNNHRPGGHYGFARWSKWREITTAPDHRWVLPMWVAYYSTGRAWKLWERLIGWVGLVPFAPPEGDAVCSHYLVLGATGSGKGASVFSHIMATSKVPTIYQDEKAECPMRQHPAWSEAIRWGCAVPGGLESHRWNPIEECRQDDNPENAFLTLAAALIPDDVAGSQNAWIPRLTRPVLAEILRAGEYDTLGQLADAVRTKPLAQVLDAIDVPDGLKAAMRGENVSEYITTTLYAELSAFRTGWGRAVTDGHDFRLDDLIERGGYILGAETEASRRGPIRLLWSLLLRRLMRSHTARPCNLIMDEAAKAGKIPHFAEALVTLRNRGVSIWSAWQSESLVLAIYGELEGNAILDNFGNRIALLHGISPRDAEALSRASGSWTKHTAGKLAFVQTASAAIPLITSTDLLIRARTPDDRWAIISARGATAKGHLIMARLIESEAGTPTPAPPLLRPHRLLAARWPFWVGGALALAAALAINLTWWLREDAPPHAAAPSAPPSLTPSPGAPAATPSPTMAPVVVPTPTPDPQRQAKVRDHITKAETLFASREYAAAERECDAALQLDPGSRETARLRQRIAQARRLLER